MTEKSYSSEWKVICKGLEKNDQVYCSARMPGVELPEESLLDLWYKVKARQPVWHLHHARKPREDTKFTGHLTSIIVYTAPDQTRYSCLLQDAVRGGKFRWSGVGYVELLQARAQRLCTHLTLRMSLVSLHTDFCHHLLGQTSAPCNTQPYHFSWPGGGRARQIFKLTLHFRVRGPAQEGARWHCCHKYFFLTDSCTLSCQFMFQSKTRSDFT